MLCLGVKVRSCPQKSLSVTALLAGCGLSSMGTTQSLGSHSLLRVPCEAGEGGTGEEMFSSLTERGAAEWHSGDGDMFPLLSVSQCDILLWCRALL